MSFTRIAKAVSAAAVDFAERTAPARHHLVAAPENIPGALSDPYADMPWHQRERIQLAVLADLNARRDAADRAFQDEVARLRLAKRYGVAA